MRSKYNKKNHNNEGRNIDNKNGKIYTNTQMSDFTEEVEKPNTKEESKKKAKLF